MRLLSALLLLVPALCLGQVLPPMNPHVECDAVAKNCRMHYLLPTANYYDVSQAVTHNFDISYAAMDPNGWSTHLQITKATLTLLGPQVYNMGGAVLILEDIDADTRVGAVWDPFLVVVDGETRRTDSWSPGIRMTNTQDICFEYQNRPYGGANYSWIYGASLYRAVWVDLWYHVGD